MTDSDIRDRLRPGQPTPWNADTPVGQPDVRTPITGFTSAVQWGLASVLIGCTVLVTASVVLVFNVLLFHGGPVGIPTGLALAGGLIATLVVSGLGLAGLSFGVRGWQQAYAEGSSPGLSIAGVGASVTALAAWLIVAIDLVAILLSFNR
jgi:hypothetical protein